MIIAHRPPAVRWRKVLLAVGLIVGYSVFGVALVEPANHQVSEWRADRMARAQPEMICRVYPRASGCSRVDQALDAVARFKI